MKYSNILVLVAVSIIGFNAFGESEMDSEINDLQVKIIHLNPSTQKPKAASIRPAQQQVAPKIYTYSTRPAQKTATSTPVRANFYKPMVVSKPTYVASTAVPTTATPTTRHEVDANGNTNTFQPAEQYQAYEDTAPEPAPRGNIRTSSSRSSISSQIIRRLELIPSFTMSSFDGGDSSLLQPSGVSSPYNSAPSMSLLTDIDFGNANFFVESGIMFTQIGAGTGQANENGFSGNFTTLSEKVALTYVGVPLNIKFRLRDQQDSSFFIKAGAIPMYMVSHAYSITGSAQSQEYRFGAYNTFDLLFDAGVGYDLKVWKDFHAVADISAFQGAFPVLTNFNVLNYGVNLGLGIAYML